MMMICLYDTNDRLYQIARTKGLSSANIVKGFASTGIWPLKGIAALPPALLHPQQLTDEEIEEARDEAWNSCDIAEQLADLAMRQRTLTAKAILLQAAQSAGEASALNALFGNQYRKLQEHAAAMKSKPRAFRVAQPQGQAKLYTSAEAWALIEEDLKKKRDDELQKEADRARKEADKEAKRLADEAERRRKEKEKAEAAEKKKEEEAKKVEARQLKKRIREEKLKAAEEEKARKAREKKEARELREKAEAEEMAAKVAERLKRKQCAESGPQKAGKKRKIGTILQNSTNEPSSSAP